MKYEDLLKDPRWQKRRLEIMQRDNFTCQHCGNGLNDGVPLNVHHIKYHKNKMPWEYNDADLTTLCEKCHEEKHSVKTKTNQSIYKVGKGKLVLFRNLLKEERLTPDGKIILSYVLTHEKTSNKRLSEILNMSRQTVISSMKKIEKFRLIEQKDYILSSGYFELKTETKLTKQLFIFYSWLYDKAYSNINGHSYNGTIDTFSCALAERFGTTKIHVRVMLSRLYRIGLAKRLDNGKLLILKHKTTITMKKLTFDIMVGDKFYRTMHMPIDVDMIEGYDGEQPIIKGEKIKEWVLKKCPTLKYDNFTICF